MGSISKYREERKKAFRSLRRKYSPDDIDELIAEAMVPPQTIQTPLDPGVIDFASPVIVSAEGNTFTFSNLENAKSTLVYLESADAATPETYEFPSYVDWEGGAAPSWSGRPAWLLQFVVTDATEGSEKVVASVVPLGTVAETASGKLFTSVGQNTFTIPPNVTSISVVCVGGGGAGADIHDGCGGGGGALAFKNNIAVTPGDSVIVTVGNGGNVTQSTSRTNTPGGDGGDSYITIGGTIYAKASGGRGGDNGFTADVYGNAATFSDADGGGHGGEIVRKSGTRSGGSGAGGYTGKGGRSGAYNYSTAHGATAGTGGGGGGGEGANGSATAYAAGGGGVDVYGEGENGIASTWTGSAVTPAGGGSGGEAGLLNAGSHGLPSSNGGKYGGGGAGGHGTDFAGLGAQGAVRIIWGTGRAFPNTQTSKMGSEE